MEKIFYVTETVDTWVDDHSNGYGSLVETVKGIYPNDVEALKHPGVNQKITTKRRGVRTTTSLTLKTIEIGGVLRDEHC